MATKKKISVKKAASTRTASKQAVAKGSASIPAPGIGRSAITGRFMSVASAKAHKKTAMVQGAGRKKK
jgi:hypothetical protein